MGEISPIKPGSVRLFLFSLSSFWGNRVDLLHLGRTVRLPLCPLVERLAASHQLQQNGNDRFP